MGNGMMGWMGIPLLHCLLLQVMRCEAVGNKVKIIADEERLLLLLMLVVKPS